MVLHKDAQTDMVSIYILIRKPQVKGSNPLAGSTARVWNEAPDDFERSLSVPLVTNADYWGPGGLSDTMDRCTGDG